MSEQKPGEPAEPADEGLADDPSKPAREAEARGEGLHPAGKDQHAGRPAEQAD